MTHLYQLQTLAKSKKGFIDSATISTCRAICVGLL